jgi:ABC-2 type transport system permease protein
VSHSIIRELVIKDLRIARPLLVGSFAVGLLSIAALPWSRLAFYVGSIAFMVTLILMNVLVVSLSLINERKDKTRLFILSLPVSTMQYNVAKLLSSLIAYVVPAAVLTTLAVLLLVLTPLPNGFIPLTLALSVHCFLYFCCYLAFALVTDSPGLQTAVIVAGNVSITFVIQGLIMQPSIGPNLGGEVAVWSAGLIGFFAVELALCVAALAISFVVYSRKTEFV